MAEKKLFNTTELLDMGLPSYPPKGGKIISDNIEDHSRWSVHHCIIVQFPGQDEDEAWSMHYSIGATECQDESPWEREDEVEATLVKRQQKTITVWE